MMISRFPVFVSAVGLSLGVLCGTAQAQSTYQFSTLAGQSTPAGYVDGPGAVARFSAPAGVAVDAAGNIFVADSNNAVIRKITPDGMVSTFAGKAGNSTQVNGAAADARFDEPRQMAFGPDGALYLAERSDRSAVRRIGADGFVSTVAGGIYNGRNNDDGPLDKATFNGANGIALDAEGRIYVADARNNNLRVIYPGAYVATLAGSNVSGWDDGVGTAARFAYPTGVVADAAGNLYVADSGNATIRRVTPQGVVTTYAGTPNNFGSTDGARATALFNRPNGLARDQAGNLYVADAGNSVIRKISAAGDVSTLAGRALSPGGDDGLGGAARFSEPTALAVHPDGSVIVADTGNNAIRRITPAGQVTTIAGRSAIGSEDGTGPAARFYQAASGAVDSAGNFYVLDQINATLRKVTPQGVVTTLAGKAGVRGSADGTGETARFNYPEALAIDAAGTIYVADSQNFTIRKVTPAGEVSTLAGVATEGGYRDGQGTAARFNLVESIAVDDAGNVYVGDTYNYRIRKITPAGLVTTLAGSGARRDPQRVADGSATEAAFYQTDGLVWTRNRGLIVADNRQIRQVAADGRVTTLVKSEPYESLDGTLAQAAFSWISALTVDAAGNLFVGDQSMVRQITTDGRVVTLGGNSGYYGRGYSDGIGGAAHFAGVNGIAVDAAGRLFVADAGNHVIRLGVPVAAAMAPIITNTVAENRRVGLGAPVSYRVSAAGTVPLTYTWFKNDVRIEGATTDTLAFSRVTAADEGNYRVVVGNSAGSASAFMGSFSVFSPPITAFTKRHETAGGSFLWSIAQSNGRLVAVGTGGTILTSTDGRTWARQNTGANDWLVGVTAGPDQFVIVGEAGHIYTSPDGQAWSRVADSGTTQRLNNIVYGRGKYVAVGEGGTIVTSPDARTWTPQKSGVTTWLRGLAYNASQGFFAVGGQNGVFMTSPDAITWGAESDGEAPSDVEAVAAMDSYGTFAGIGQDGLTFKSQRYSSYGRPGWFFSTDTQTGTTARLRGLAVGANTIFATGENGAIISAAAFAGPWAQLDSGTTANLVGGVYSGNTLYIVGENETILQSEPIYNSRLINISTRGAVTVDKPMISGFVVQGDRPKRVLLRAVGPTLADFGVTNPLPAPTLTLYDAKSIELASNTGWLTRPDTADLAATAVRVGAFPLAKPADSAILVTLPPGAYTAKVSTATGSGVALVEAYDADTVSNESSRAINISTRGVAGTGSNTLTAGFVLNGTAARRVLIRAVGPALAGFGVSDTLARPRLQVLDSRGGSRASAGAWSAQVNFAEIRNAAVVSGAFALPEGSADSAFVTTLDPGAWTVQVTGENNTTGAVLIEVYDIP